MTLFANSRFCREVEWEVEELSLSLIDCTIGCMCCCDYDFTWGLSDGS